MHFNIYLDNQLGERLTKLSKTSHQSRNALIREAIRAWLDKNEKATWPEEIKQFNGVKNFPAFESHRQDLQAPTDDPFA